MDVLNPFVEFMGVYYLATLWVSRMDWLEIRAGEA